mmetsp:Transcript_11608/g.45131  ORF Transcript_11608/g.45131 Transcript_11608/m.45131 type:complete len:204 (+) Transcript_11608:757-1368(+)
MWATNSKRCPVWRRPTGSGPRSTPSTCTCQSAGATSAGWTTRSTYPPAGPTSRGTRARPSRLCTTPSTSSAPSTATSRQPSATLACPRPSSTASSARSPLCSSSIRCRPTASPPTSRPRWAAKPSWGASTPSATSPSTRQGPPCAALGDARPPSAAFGDARPPSAALGDSLSPSARTSRRRWRCRIAPRPQRKAAALEVVTRA